MPLTCTVCDYKFEERAAVCIDWRDPERSFGCPQCHTFYQGVQRKWSVAQKMMGTFASSSGVAWAVFSYWNPSTVFQNILCGGGVLLWSMFIWLCFPATGRDELIQPPYHHQADSNNGEGSLDAFSEVKHQRS